MQHLLLLLLQQDVFGVLLGHTSSSCILSTLVILCNLLPGLQAAEMAMVNTTTVLLCISCSLVLADL